MHVETLINIMMEPSFIRVAFFIMAVVIPIYCIFFMSCAGSNMSAFYIGVIVSILVITILGIG